MPQNAGMSPVCPYCGVEDETVAHLWWRCSRWNDCREGLGDPAGLPTCFVEMGVVPEGFREDFDVCRAQRAMVEIFVMRAVNDP